MMGDMDGLGWWGPGFGWVFMLLFWLLIILGAAALIKWLVSQSRGQSSHAKKRRWKYYRHATPVVR